MDVADVVKHKGGAIFTLTEDQPLSAAIALMATNKVGAVVITSLRDGAPLGIVSEADIVAMLSTHGDRGMDRPAQKAMRSPAPHCSANETVAAALAMMTRARSRYLIAIAEGGVVLGLISIGDLVKARLESAEMEASVLRDVARGRILAGLEREAEGWR